MKKLIGAFRDYENATNKLEIYDTNKQVRYSCENLAFNDGKCGLTIHTR